MDDDDVPKKKCDDLRDRVLSCIRKSDAYKYDGKSIKECYNEMAHDDPCMVRESTQCSWY